MNMQLQQDTDKWFKVNHLRIYLIKSVDITITDIHVEHTSLYVYTLLSFNNFYIDRYDIC
jgi:hypothetical protein